MNVGDKVKIKDDASGTLHAGEIAVIERVEPSRSKVQWYKLRFNEDEINGWGYYSEDEIVEYVDPHENIVRRDNVLEGRLRRHEQRLAEFDPDNGRRMT